MNTYEKATNLAQKVQKEDSEVLQELAKVTMPNFHQWAKNIYSPNESVNRTLVDIQIALEQAFDSGRSLGRREAIDESGYEEWMGQEPNIIELSDEDRKNLIKDSK